MKKLFMIFVCSLVIMIISAPKIYSWGFFGHKKINRMAVLTLPPQMIGFFKRHIDFLTEHAVDPDKRRYAVDGEAPRHYIDIDHYSEEHPFEIMPRNWDSAVAKFTEDTLQAYGIVPWHLNTMHKKMTRAFQSENMDWLLNTAADFGHYIGDSHVPLHTTENYNGQLTGQKGIHGFWESRLPELFSEDYDYFVGKARYIESPLDYAWETVEASHAAKDSVLDFEMKLTKNSPVDAKYVYEQRGATTMKTYSREFSKEYHNMMAGMVERRMKRAIISTGSFWYTSWVDAGKPALDKFDGKQLSEKTKKEQKKLEEQFRGGKIKGRAHDK